MFNFIKNRQNQKKKARILYKSAETQARQPVFYEEYGVPDTPYARFDMISLHCYLLVRRLNKAGERKIAQWIFDIMFKTLDLAMREMGVGDLSVPKKMKKFMQAFNGRANHYESALKAGDDAALMEVIKRNIYGTADVVNDLDLKMMVDYIKMNADLDLTGEAFITPEKRKAA